MTPTKVIKRILAWSFSRFSVYDNCPKDAYYRYIEKQPLPPPGPPMLRGTKIHDIAEAYVLGRIKGRIPTELKLFSGEFKDLKKIKTGIMVEQQWAFTVKWVETSWFGAEAWLRCVLDVAYEYTCRTGLPSAQPKALNKGNKPKPTTSMQILKVIDYKTGKIREEQKEQLELYALAGFSKFDHIDRVEAEFWYLDQGEIRKFKLDRKDLAKLRAKWKRKTKAMLNDTIFAARPGNACRWCHYKKKNGGPCEY